MTKYVSQYSIMSLHRLGTNERYLHYDTVGIREKPDDLLGNIGICHSTVKFVFIQLRIARRLRESPKEKDNKSQIFKN